MQPKQPSVSTQDVKPPQLVKQVPKKKKKEAKVEAVVTPGVAETKPDPITEAKPHPKLKIPEPEIGWSVIESKRGSARKAKAE